MPPTTSPSPSSSATPRRAVGAEARPRPRPRGSTGAPPAPARSGDAAQVLEALARSRGRAPRTRGRASSRLLPARVLVRVAHGADHLAERDAERRAGGSGSTCTWYWRTKPPTEATSATPGHALRARSAGSSPGGCAARRGRGARCGRRARTRRPSRRPSRRARGSGSTPSGSAPRDAGQVLEHAAARPVEVGAVLEDHVDERDAEERLPRTERTPGAESSARRDRVGDLVLDQLGAAARATR